MTLRLILLRHAKSSWDDFAQSDHDRPLNKRGRGAAKAIGGWLAEQGYLPEHVLCSTAARTRETLTRAAVTAEATFLQSLYHASADRILDLIQTHGAGQSLMVVGHNPGAAEFAERIVMSAPRHARFRDYPSGAALVVEFEADNWSDVRFGSGSVLAFIVPCELMD